MQINRAILHNGLRVVHNEDTATQMVAVNTLYCVGSRNESPDHTGFAHLFEHLMFGGSVNIPDFERPLQDACGENNAFTDSDITNFYITLPAQNVQTAFWLESDRMRSLAFTPESLEVQRKVVMEEFKQNYLNQPYGDVAHLLFKTIYRVHPYRWPTIGLSLDHIADATMDDVKTFFHRFYRPDNAVLSVVGNISWPRTLELVEHWFGDIPRGTADMGKDAIPQEPSQLRQRRLTVRRKVQSPLLVLAFVIPKVTDPEFRVCDMLSDVMANGKSSRFHQSLVERQKLFISIDASVMGRIDGSLLMVEGMMSPDADVDRCEEAIWEEIERLKRDLVDEAELQKLKNKYEFNHHLQTSNYMQRAQLFAAFEAYSDARDIDREVERYCATTSQLLRSVCRKYLTRRNSTVLRYLIK